MQHSKVIRKFIYFYLKNGSFKAIETEKLLYCLNEDRPGTIYTPVLLIYTPGKHQKTVRFSDVFRGYSQATPGCNKLKGETVSLT